MYLEVRSILLDGPVDYLIFSKSKVYLREPKFAVSMVGRIIERDSDHIFVKLDEFSPNDRPLFDMLDTVDVSTGYRSKELHLDTTPVGCSEDGILQLRFPRHGTLRNKRNEFRQQFKANNEFSATLHIATVTSQIQLKTSWLVDFSPKTIALELDRGQGLALPGDKVTQITIQSKGEILFESHGVVQRVDMNSHNYKEHDRYLLIVGLFSVYRNSIVDINNNRRHSDRTALFHENAAFVQFYHPFFSEHLLTYSIVDLSNSGFSFAMGEQEPPMPQGLVVRNASVQLPRKQRLEVSFVVSYVQDLEPSLEQAGFVQRIGVRLIDVTSEVLKEVTNFIQKENSEFLTDANSDDYYRLWEFYFETSFIYGSKRKQIQPFSDKVFDTDKKLMQSNTPLVKKVLYKQDGEIKGHLATIKIFDDTLIIQHLNASKTAGASAGQSVIRAMTTYFLDHYANQQAANRYVCAYYRPENLYPDLVFGKTAVLVNDPHICWTRNYRFCLPSPQPVSVKQNIICTDATDIDLRDLEVLLIERDEILLMRVEGLYRESMQALKVSKEFEKIGLYRYRKVFVARDSVSQSVAYAICNYTSPGVNFSELTNSVKFFYKSATAAIAQELADGLGQIVLKSYRDTDMPNCVLLLTEDQPIPAGFMHTKSYIWWVLDLKFVNKFREATEHIFLNMKEYLRSRRKIENDINAG